MNILFFFFFFFVVVALSLSPFFFDLSETNKEKSQTATTTSLTQMAASSSSAPLAIVTGGYGVFGRHICAGIAATGKYTVVAVGRDKVAGLQLVDTLKKAYPTAPEPRFAAVDCGSLDQIRNFCSSLTAPVAILVNNVAVVPSKREETSDGVEKSWNTNVLSYQRFTRSLWMGKHFTPNARVTMVASNYAGSLNLDDPEFRKTAFDANTAYMMSKQANRMLAAEWARYLATRAPGIVVTSCHPAVANSKVLSGLGFSSGEESVESQKKGAVTPLHCVLSETGIVSGKFYDNKAVSTCRFSDDLAACSKLWDIVEAYDDGRRVRGE